MQVLKLCIDFSWKNRLMMWIGENRNTFCREKTQEPFKYYLLVGPAIYYNTFVTDVL